MVNLPAKLVPATMCERIRLVGARNVPPPFREWSSGRLVRWLDEKGMESLGTLAEDNKWDGAKLTGFDDAELRLLERHQKAQELPLRRALGGVTTYTPDHAVNHDPHPVAREQVVNAKRTPGLIFEPGGRSRWDFESDGFKGGQSAGDACQGLRYYFDDDWDTMPMWLMGINLRLRVQSSNLPI